MGLQKQNSISSFIRKPFKKKKKSKSKSCGAPAGDAVTSNGACSAAAAGPVCERCAPLESRVSLLSAELRELRTELAALKGGVTALQTQVSRGEAASRGRHRRDSYESCWDAASLRFYTAHEVLQPTRLTARNGKSPPPPPGRHGSPRRRGVPDLALHAARSVVTVAAENAT